MIARRWVKVIDIKVGQPTKSVLHSRYLPLYSIRCTIPSIVERVVLLVERVAGVLFVTNQIIKQKYFPMPSLVELVSPKIN